VVLALHQAHTSFHVLLWAVLLYLSVLKKLLTYVLHYICPYTLDIPLVAANVFATNEQEWQ
jgi:hypothetical protein